MIRNLLLLGGLVLALAGCRQEPVREPTGESGGAGAGAQAIRTFQVRGVIVNLTPAENRVRIKHEEIPDYMPAMTMPFNIRDTNLLAGLQPGDAVEFRLNVTEDDDWIDGLRKTGTGSPAPETANPPGETGAFRRVRDVEPLEIGEVLPEYRFTNQLGQPISTGQFRGKALAVTFIFTRCPLPTFCPRMGQNFSKAQAMLLGEPDAPANWHLLTLSFDPEFDRPAVLKQYAEGQGYNPAHWTFATGALIDITAIGEQFGLTFGRDESGSISHNLRTAVIDPAGRVRRIFEGNEWDAKELAAELRAAAANLPTPDNRVR